MIACVSLLAIGIASANGYPLSSITITLGIGIVACLAVTSAVRGWRWVAWGSAALLVVLIGHGLLVRSIAPPIDPLHVRYWLPPIGGQVLCEGMVAARPVVGIERTRVLIDLTACQDPEDRSLMRPRHGRVAVSVLDGNTTVDYGDRVRLMARLHTPTAYRNPGGDARYLRTQIDGIAAVGMVTQAGALQRVAETRGRWLRRAIGRWTERVEDVIGQVAQGDARGILMATITGNGSGLSQEAWDRFRRVGVIHLLVISGFQVSCVAIAVWFLIGWLLRRSAWLAVRTSLWKWSAVFCGAAIWIYALFVGASTPVIRAALMVSGVLVAVVADRRRELPSLLAGAALLILCVSPLTLFLPSFQLTFAAVIGILLWWPWLRARCRFDRADGAMDGWYRKGWRWSGESACATVAASIGVFPLVAYHFHTTSQMGLVSNLLFVPLVGMVLTPLGLVFACAAPWWPAAAATLGALLQWIAEAMLIGVAWADAHSAPWQLGFTPTFVECVLWYAAWIVPVIWRVRYWRRFVGAAAIACAVWSVGWRMAYHLLPQPLMMTFLDVGQGSAAVVRFPNRKVMVVDAGGIAGSPFDIGRWVVAPALHRLQIHTIDTLVLTHPHPDHYGGLPYLAETFAPREFWFTGATVDADDPAWPMVLARIAATGVPTRIFNAATPPMNEGGVRIRTLHPGPNGPQMVYGHNNNSIVQLLEYGDVRILLTGDIEQEAEAQIVQRERIGRVDLLQAPHHGSKTSSTATFLADVQPRTVVISCGRQNRFGFPSPEVSARYAQMGTQVYRIDQHGAITVRTDGKSLEVIPYFIEK